MASEPPRFGLLRLDDAAELLRLHREEWDDETLRDLAVFGSVARDAARPESDIDLLLTFERAVGLLAFVRYKLLFEDILSRRVDVVTPEGLRPELRQDVLEDAVSLTRREHARPGEPRRKRWRWRLREMLACCERASRFTEGMDEARFRAPEAEVVRHAVLHNLLVLGESVSYLPEDVRLLHPDVPWAELRQMRHLIAHDYFGLDVGMVWRTVNEELPQIKEMLASV